MSPFVSAILRSKPANFLRKCQMSSKITCIQRGSLYTPDFRLYFKNETGPISPFHDIPHLAGPSPDILNMVVEIPRWTNAKMEIATKEPLNPIKQDTKNGNLRFVANVFPYHGYIWNYGAIPQTWENPEIAEKTTKCKGDNDPIDALELGGAVHETGSVIQVKLLGCIGIIDEGEMDWKLFVIDVNDPLASKLNDVADIEEVMPGQIRATADWFCIYKIPCGNLPNRLAFDGDARNKEFALKLLGETHDQWTKLIEKKTENKTNLSLENTTCQQSPFRIKQTAAKKITSAGSSPGPPKYRDDPGISKWWYVH